MKSLISSSRGFLISPSIFLEKMRAPMIKPSMYLPFMIKNEHHQSPQSPQPQPRAVCGRTVGVFSHSVIPCCEELCELCYEKLTVHFQKCDEEERNEKETIAVCGEKSRYFYCDDIECDVCASQPEKQPELLDVVPYKTPCGKDPSYWHCSDMFCVICHDEIYQDEVECDDPEDEHDDWDARSNTSGVSYDSWFECVGPGKYY